MKANKAASRTLALTSFISIVVIFLLLYHEFRSVKSAIILIDAIGLDCVFALLVTTGEVNDLPSSGSYPCLASPRNGMLLISHYKHLQGEGYRVCATVLYAVRFLIV